MGFVAGNIVESKRRHGGRICMHSGRIEFVTAKPCPFAQRVWIALEESKLPYELIEVQLYGGKKPAWFKKLNPAGKVPVLIVHGDSDGESPTVVTESQRICLYVAEKLSSADTGLRLQDTRPIVRWQAWTDDELGRHGKEQVTRGGMGGRIGDPGLQSSLEHLEKELKANGPYLCGPEFSVADISLYPFLSRLLESFDVPRDDFASTWAYLKRLEARDSISKTTPKSWWWWW